MRSFPISRAAIAGRSYCPDRSSFRSVIEDGPASIAQVRFSLPETGLHVRGVGDVAKAQPEGVRRACGPLLRSAAVLLRKGNPIAEKSRQHDDQCVLEHKKSFLRLRHWFFERETQPSRSGVPRPSNSPTRACECSLLTYPAALGVYELYGIVYFGSRKCQPCCCRSQGKIRGPGLRSHP